MKLHSNSELPFPVRVVSSRKTVEIIRECVAIVLVGALLGVCSPVLADDFVPQKFNVLPAGLGVTLGPRGVSSEPELPGFSTQTGLAGANAAFSPQDPNQQQPTQPAYQPPPQRHWTKTGKIETIIGAGLIVPGLLAASNNRPGVCEAPTCADPGLSHFYLGVGLVAVGLGAAMVIPGLTRRGN